MNLDRKREAIEKKMRSMYGMADEKKEHINNELAKMDDWFTVCRFCGKKISGTPDEVTEHVVNCAELKRNETSQ